MQETQFSSEMNHLLNLLQSAGLQLDDIPQFGEMHLTYLTTSYSQEVKIINRPGGITELLYPKKKVIIYVVKGQVNDASLMGFIHTVAPHVDNVISIEKAKTHQGATWYFMTFALISPSKKKPAKKSITNQDIYSYAIENQFYEKPSEQWSLYMLKFNYKKKQEKFNEKTQFEENAWNRVNKELEEFRNFVQQLIDQQKLDTLNYYIHPNSAKPNQLLALLKGPAHSYYQNFAYQVQISLSNYHPYKAPEVTFLSTMFHPNIDYQTGKLYLPLLQEKEYKQEITLEDILKAILLILEKPIIEDKSAILNEQAATMLSKQDKQFATLVSEETLKEPTVKLTVDEPPVIIEQQ